MEAWGCPVTDDGIKGLCVSVDDFGKENAGLGQCKSLHTLDIFGTKVTTKGVEMALENLPDLKVFDCSYQIQVLAELLRGPLRKNLACVPNLISLNNTGLPFEPNPAICQRGDIELVAATCVSVNNVRIDGDVIVRNGHTDVTVQELLKLEKLCQLSFRRKMLHDWALTFSGGILPILKHFSSSLTYLSLEFLSNTLVNIRAIVENCPQLQTLNISGCMTSPPQRLEDDQKPSKRIKLNPVLENLKTLKLNYCFDLTVEDFDLLLASPALNKLSLDSIFLPIDDSLRRATNLHKFRNLQRLKFRLLHRVTKAGIDSLMNDGNSLKVIKLRICHLLKVEDIAEWKRVALDKNWDVNFQFL